MACRKASLGVVALAIVLGACGSSSHQSAGQKPSASHKQGSSLSASRVTTASTTTTTLPPLTSVDYAQGACRSFVSFYGHVTAVGMSNADAIGDIGGMVAQADRAVSMAPTQAGEAKLVADLKSLAVVASSSQWLRTPKEASAPQMATVAADCKAFQTP